MKGDANIKIRRDFRNGLNQEILEVRCHLMLPLDSLVFLLSSHIVYIKGKFPKSFRQQYIQLDDCQC